MKPIPITQYFAYCENLSTRQVILLNRYAEACLNLHVERKGKEPADVEVFRKNIKMDFLRHVESKDDSWDRLEQVYGTQIELPEQNEPV